MKSVNVIFRADENLKAQADALLAEWGGNFPLNV